MTVGSMFLLNKCNTMSTCIKGLLYIISWMKWNALNKVRRESDLVGKIFHTELLTTDLTLVIAWLNEPDQRSGLVQVYRFLSYRYYNHPFVHIVNSTKAASSCVCQDSLILLFRFSPENYRRWIKHVLNSIFIWQNALYARHVH